MSFPPAPCSVPTLYFIGVTTARSSIMRVFPRWADVLGLDAEIVGVDFALHDRPERYRQIVEHIKSDPLAMGALVTTHKLDLLDAARDLFDGLGPYAARLGEVSCLSMHGERLIGSAMDPISSGLALDAFLPEAHWDSGGEALILGAGGSSLALSVSLLERVRDGRPHPRRIVVTNRSPGRLQEMREVHRALDADVDVEYVHAPLPRDNDRVCHDMAPGSLVANATGLGKDRPGSPLTDDAILPQGGLLWDFNYRGDLHFLVQARRQQARCDLVVEDGWVYFIHGWTRVISEVFQIDIPTSGPSFDKLSDVAARARSAATEGG
jgi:shikimate 5-dehydrogenase